MENSSVVIFSLEEENSFLKGENSFLKSENAHLCLEVSKLQERLGLNSKNSSIPSSKELYKTKKSDRTKSFRKAGGQPGHKGVNRPKLPANEVVDLPLDSLSCSCGGAIALSRKPYPFTGVAEIPRTPFSRLD